MEFGHAAAVGDVPLVQADVGDPRAVLEAVDRFGVDSVVHFAAYKSPAESMAQPQRYFGNNSCQGLAPRDPARIGSQPVRLLVHLCRLRDSPTVPVAEDAAVRPESPYGESKAITERVLGLVRPLPGTFGR